MTLHDLLESRAAKSGALRISCLVFVLCMMALAVCKVISSSDSRPAVERDISRRIHPYSADGVDLWLGDVHVKATSVNVRKRKLGALTLAGFNLLEVDGLELTIAAPSSLEGAPASSDAPRAAILEGVGGGSGFASGLAPGIRLSGVKIYGFTCKRAVAAKDTPPSPWLEARALANRGKTLHFEDLVLHDAGAVRKLSPARLSLDGGLVVEYGPDFSNRLTIAQVNGGIAL